MQSDRLPGLKAEKSAPSLRVIYFQLGGNDVILKKKRGGVEGKEDLKQMKTGRSDGRPNRKAL